MLVGIMIMDRFTHIFSSLNKYRDWKESRLESICNLETLITFFQVTGGYHNLITHTKYDIDVYSRTRMRKHL